MLRRRNITTLPSSRGERKSRRERKSLEQAYLDQCLKLSAFPNMSETMANLTTLKLEGAAITFLSENIGKLKSLKCLNVGRCSRLKIFPNSIADIATPRTPKSCLLTQNSSKQRREDDIPGIPPRLRTLPNSWGSMLSLTQVYFAGSATGLLRDVDVACTPNLYTLLEIEPAHLGIHDDDESSLIDDVCLSRKPKHGYIGWVLPVINIILEALLAYFDQVSSPKKPQYALIAMLTSFVAVAMSTIELNRKTRKAHVILRRWDCAFIDIFGLICAIFQCIFSIIQYVYHIQHAGSPIKISVLPLIFAICAAGSRFFSQRELEPLIHSHMP